MNKCRFSSAIKLTSVCFALLLVCNVAHSKKTQKQKRSIASENSGFVRRDLIDENIRKIEWLLELIPVSSYHERYFFKCKPGSDMETLLRIKTSPNSVLFRDSKSNHVDLYACGSTETYDAIGVRDCLKFKLDRAENKIISISTYREELKFDISEQREIGTPKFEKECIIDYAEPTHQEFRGGLPPTF